MQLQCGPLIQVSAVATNVDFKKPEVPYPDHVCPPGSGCKYYDSKESSILETEFHFLPIVEDRNKHRGEKLQIYGLIVKRCIEHKKGIFQRVGAFDLGFWGQETYADWINACSKLSGVFIDEKNYGEVLQPNLEGIKQYRITII